SYSGITMRKDVKVFHGKVRGRIWVETGKGAFLGVGRIELLIKIRESGSISKAAKAMKMSYRQAWELIESMNQKSKKPLVISKTGGKGGGGATITEAGEKAIRDFSKLNLAFRKFLIRQSAIFNG
ncbi:MAG: winged helix-turn-helix domain-containing protein, partial [Cytophagaceae bacterium]